MSFYLLCDRDGVLNQDNGYSFKIEDLVFCDGVIEGLSLLRDHGCQFIVITNQSGIARGFYTLGQMHQFHLEMQKQLKKNKIEILDFFYCPHHVDGEVKKFRKDCDCRKPKPGMVLNAIKKFKIDKKSCVMIGDKISDIECADNAGIDGIQLAHGRDETSKAKYQAKNFLDAANWVLKHYLSK